jgi:MinD superfamily P-loop ATPase
MAKNAVIADCDVDAPDLHLLLHPKTLKRQAFKGSKLAVIDKSKCTECEICRNKCRFDAIGAGIDVDPIACDGCGVCTIVCPTNAVTLVDRISGYAYTSETRCGLMAHALLSAGEANSGKLVALVRQNAKTLADNGLSELIIIDGPPGIGCPVIASVAGVTAGLVVTEPTLSGIHDLERALHLLRHFNVRSFVCINMHDINSENSSRIEDFCKENGIRVLGKVPFDPTVTEAMVNGKTVVEYAPKSEASREITSIWKNLLTSM